VPVERSTNVQYLHDVMTASGLASSSRLPATADSPFVGLSRAETQRRVSDAAAFINVMGFLHRPGDTRQRSSARLLRHRPWFGQMWCDLGLHNPYAGYDPT
jgi:hypothetical protein